MTPRITLRDLALMPRLHAVNATVGEGERIGIVGPNGGGKTSLLRSIAGIERFTGEALIDGQDVTAILPARRPTILSFLPASRDLAWPIAVRDVIALGLTARDDERVDAMMSLFELEAVAMRPADSLSTGERTRVLLARALVSQPALLLLDEPFANLDPYWVLRLREILDAEASRGTAVLVALHDLAMAEAFDRLWLVAGGTLLADDMPDAVLESDALAQAFGIERRDGRWAISRQADPRSSR